MKIKKISLLLLAAISLGSIFSFNVIDKYTYGSNKGMYINRNTEYKNDNLLLVNKKNPVNSDYVPNNLVKCNIPFIDSSDEKDMYLIEEAAGALEELFHAAKNEGIDLLGTSAYRSYDDQKAVYQQNVATRGLKEANRYAAKPGKSEHQTGLAIDVTNKQRWFHESTKEAIWLADNAHRFGFILRFLQGKEHITGYSFEPWHIRYVGKDVANDIYSRKITLEEYLENI